MNRTLFLAFAFVMTLACRSQESSLADSWHGDLVLGADKLPLTLSITDQVGTFACSFGSPAQGATDIPAQITVAADSVAIAIPSIGATYTGIYKGDKISGTFRQSGMSFPLTFLRGILQKPQTPQEPLPYIVREVSFPATDGIELHGTLTLPVNYRMPFLKKFPAVVLVSGSGIQDRDETIGAHKPFAVIAHHLALNGIASLRYDDRGFTDPADAADATTAVFADDARAAVACLRSSFDKAGKVGVIGHSEGGTIAMMLAADSAADFAVSMAGVAIPGDSLLLLQNAAMLTKVGLDPAVIGDYIVALRRVFSFMKANPGATNWPGLDDAMADLENLPQEMAANLAAAIASRNPWLDAFLASDPATMLPSIAVPLLAINGENDLQVPCDANLAALRQNIKKEYLTAKSYTGLNHLFQHCATGLPSEYAALEETISPEVLADIAAWILSLK